MRLSAAFALCVTGSVAHAQVHKCQDGSGATVYADFPCAGGSKTLTLRNDAKASATGRTVCAQLLDERHRLAADADRAAKRGRVESAASARRREALARQYEARCIGITRSGQ